MDKQDEETLKEALTQLLDSYRLRSILDTLSTICFSRGKGDSFERPDLWTDAALCIDRAVAQIMSPENSNTDENE